MPYDSASPCRWAQLYPCRHPLSRGPQIKEKTLGVNLAANSYLFSIISQTFV